LERFLASGFSEREIASITLEDCETFWVGFRAQYPNGRTPNILITRLRHVWKTALRWKLASENPWLEIKKARQIEREWIALTDEQELQIFQAARPPLKDYLIWARYTGARRLSLVKLEARDIDLTRGLITFRDTKAGHNYSIRIHHVLVGWFQTWREEHPDATPTTRILHQYSDEAVISRAFKRLCDRLGIHGFRFHDWRHRVGAKLGEANFHPRIIQAMLGHKDPRMALRYTHVSQDVIKNAIESVL
jgi:integrase